MALITGLFGAFANTVAAVEGTLLCILNDVRSELKFGLDIAVLRAVSVRLCSFARYR